MADAGVGTFGSDPNGNCELRGTQVPNLPSLVARTATHALANMTLPYVSALAGDGDTISLGTSELTVRIR